MKLIIDAYNILKQVSKNSLISEQMRNTFINRIKKFTHKKNVKALIVFDGGYSPWPTKEPDKHIITVYSGTQQTADDYIKNYIFFHTQEDLILVSSDRDLCLYASEHETPSLDASVFHELIELFFKKNTAQVSSSTQLTKTSSESSNEVDILMQDDIQRVPQKDNNFAFQDIFKHNKESKKDRRLLEKIKKLL